MTARRRFNIIVLLLICLAVSFTTAALHSDNNRADAASNNIIKLSINIPEEYRAGGAKAGSEIYLNYSLFNWIEATPALYEGGTLSYKVYSPNAVAGIGGISGQFTGDGENSWQILHNTMANLNLKDTNGYSMAATADISDVISNGWYQRDMVMTRPFAGPVLAPYRIGHISIPVCIPEGTIIKSETITVYYKDIKLISNTGDVVALTNDNTSIPGGFQLGNDFKPSNSVVANWVSLSSVPEKTIPEIDESTFPRAGYVNEALDFSQTMFVGKEGGTNYSPKLTVNGVEQSSLSYTPASAGEIDVVFSVTDSLNGMSTKAARKVTVLGDKSSVYFFAEDKAAVEDALTGIQAGAVLKLPVVYGFHEGNVKATLTVKDKDDKYYEAVEKDGYYEIQLADKDMEYTAIFSAQNGDIAGSFQKDFTANYPEEPYIVTESVPTGANCGEFVSFDDVEVMDYQDGKLTPVITVVNAFGDNVNIIDNGFYASVAGTYTIRISATDDDGNSVSEDFEFAAIKIVGQVIQWRIYIPDSLKGEGVAKASRQSIYGYIMANPYKFKSGDVLSYEVYSPSGVSGTGLIDGQHNGGSGAWNTFSVNKWFEAVDQNGIPMGPDGDITEAAADGWYYRESAVTAEMVADGDIRHFALAFSTSEAISADYIDVYYRNIKVTSVDGSEYYFYNGLHALKSEFLSGTDMANLSDMRDEMHSTMSPFYTIDVSKVKEEYYTADDNTLPCYVINYNSGEKISDVVITVEDENSAVYTLENGVIPDNVVGEVTITYKNSDGAEVGFNEAIKVSIVDTTAPSIIISEELLNVKLKKNQTYTIPEFDLSDNYDSASRIRYGIELVKPSGEKVTIDSDTESITLDSNGEYKLIITAKDSARNISTATINITVSSGNTVLIIVVAAAVVAVGAAVTLILVRKRRA